MNAKVLKVTILGCIGLMNIRIAGNALSNSHRSITKPRLWARVRCLEACEHATLILGIASGTATSTAWAIIFKELTN